MKIIDYLRQVVREYFKYLYIITPLLALITWFGTNRSMVNAKLDYLHSVLSGSTAYIGTMPNAVTIWKVSNWIFPVTECVAMMVFLIPLKASTAVIRMMKASVPGWS